MKTRTELAEKLFRGVGVELGVAAGAFSSHILRQDKVSLLYSIDRWNDHHNIAEYFTALTLLKSHGSRSLVVRASFSDVLHCIPNEHMNFIYIDGYAHTGQDEGATIRTWWSKLKSGGVFSGHDYDPAWPLTVAAVDAFVAKHNLALNTTTDDHFQSWWVVKP